MATDTLEIIRTTASVISASAIVVGASQFWLARRQFALQLRVWKTQHERSRREKAIEIIRTFTQALTAQWSSTHKLVERLDIPQLKALDDGRPFSIAETEKSEVQAALANSPLAINNGQIQLTGEQSYQLRYQALEVLNSAEIVFQAWHRDVADPEIIQQEMRFLFHPDDPQPTTLMQRYRSVFHAEKYYPAIYRFIEHINAAPQPSAPPPKLTDER
jgi:hypothetical protein